MNTINEYMTAKGKSPYATWLKGIKDAKITAKIMMLVDKMELGLFGDVKPVGDGLSELRIHCGAGYRIYFAKDKQTVYLLLCGGDKSSQAKDIRLAKAYWQDYKQRNYHGD